MPSGCAEPEVTLSVVIPVYASAGTLDALRLELDHVLETSVGYDFEIVFVDDASPDHSLSCLRRLADADPRVVVVSLGRNMGQQWAVLTGLSIGRGRRLVCMDADLQDPPAQIPILLERLDHGYAACFAARKGRYESIRRLASSRVFKGIMHGLTGMPARAGMFLAMDRRCRDAVLGRAVRVPYLPAMIARCGMRTSTVPLPRARALDGRTAYRGASRLALGLKLVAGWAVAPHRGAARVPAEVCRTLGASVYTRRQTGP